MEINSGDIIADVLREQGVEFLFTLVGGHISPLLVGANKKGISVIDVRDEVNAVLPPMQWPVSREDPVWPR